MPLTPTDWNVIVLAHWNRAILTPSGIAKRLFCLDQETPVEVFVAIDALAPPQVRHRGMTVVAWDDRLIVQPEVAGYGGLGEAMEISCRALEDLRETPVVAAGINVKYTCNEVLESLRRITRHTWWDDQLSDKDYEIVTRSLSRALKWRGGQINVSIVEGPDATVQIQLNFHRGSTDINDLIAWLTTNTTDLETQVNQILFESLELASEGMQYATTAAEA